MFPCLKLGNRPTWATEGTSDLTASSKDRMVTQSCYFLLLKERKERKKKRKGGREKESPSGNWNQDIAGKLQCEHAAPALGAWLWSHLSRKPLGNQLGVTLWAQQDSGPSGSIRIHQDRAGKGPWLSLEAEVMGVGRRACPRLDGWGANCALTLFGAYTSGVAGRGNICQKVAMFIFLKSVLCKITVAKLTLQWLSQRKNRQFSDLICVLITKHLHRTLYLQGISHCIDFLQGLLF